MYIRDILITYTCCYFRGYSIGPITGRFRYYGRFYDKQSHSKRH